MSTNNSALPGETLITRLRKQAEQWPYTKPGALIEEAADMLLTLTARIIALEQERDTLKGELEHERKDNDNIERKLSRRG